MVIHMRLGTASRKKAPYTAPLHAQLAALCTRQGADGIEVLLVTSSRGRWILPKGWPMSGCDDAEAAQIEAWEEAGVKKSKVGSKPVGSYIATKLTDAGDEEPCLLNVYELKVKKTVSDYPESDRRDRVWVTPARAAEMVDEDGLRAILAAL